MARDLHHSLHESLSTAEARISALQVCGGAGEACVLGEDGTDDDEVMDRIGDDDITAPSTRHR